MSWWLLALAYVVGAAVLMLSAFAVVVLFGQLTAWLRRHRRGGQRGRNRFQ